MFGPDTALMMDAIQIAALAAAVGAGGIYLALRLSKSGKRAEHSYSSKAEGSDPMDLAQRVENLERIATDQSLGLADEIEALRSAPSRHEEPEKGPQ
ncbi:hypothetical protein FGU71_09375 [Erythrobacter insulae]|uniref:Uncharacterized protein n=1 Tax=Erythrobacter insulae TaxID=2584124 RepID=A0A547PD33_9SPHN|nr:hypothetical protein [Erythrobacter insulae]TRD12047.1 hypothetical protein FGU71_09375 [Erythrobacter insulae]